VQGQPLPPVVVGHPLYRGLRGWWRGLPGYTGSLNLYDLTGGTLGTLVGMGTGMSGTQGWDGSTRVGGYAQLNFDGVAAVVNLGTAPQVTDLPQKTVCVWVNPTDFGSSGETHLVDKKSSGPGGWLLFWGSGGAVQWLQTFGGGAVAGQWSVPVSVPVGAWSHLCVWYDNTSPNNLPIFYVNGFYAGAVTTVVAASGTADSDASSTLYWGSNPSGSRASHGAMDDLRIWNRQLSGKEIFEVYSRSRQGDPGLLAVPGVEAVAVPVAAVPPPAHPGFLPFFTPPHLRR
jgi:hypothetical protein